MAVCAFCKQEEGNPSCGFCKDKGNSSTKPSASAGSNKFDPKQTDQVSVKKSERKGTEMELKSKVILKEKGASSDILLKQKNTSIVHAKLTWTKAVDLDLHAFYKTKTGKFGHVYFGKKGSLDKEPYIMIDEDAGVGNTAGDNEENIRITQLDKLDSVLIATNIFKFFGFLSGGENFASYDGKVIVTTDGGDNIEVPLTSKKIGKWCVIAKLDNTGPNPKLININTVQKDEPDGKSI